MKFRYSSLQTAYNCLYRFKLEELDGLKQESNSGDMAFGTAIHTGLSNFFTDSMPPAESFSGAWMTVKEKDLEYTRFGWKDLHEMGKVLLLRWEKLHSKKYKPFKVEEKIEFKVGDYDFYGTPDFIGEYEGQPTIVDFKTSKDEYPKEIAKINEQLYIYAHAAQQAYGFEAKQLQYVVFVKSKTSIQTSCNTGVDKEKVKKALTNVENVCKDIVNRDNFWKNKTSCKFCPLKERCLNE